MLSALSLRRGEEEKMHPEDKLKSMGLTLPATPTPMANYVPFRLDGRTIYLAGQGPRKLDGSGFFTGMVNGVPEFGEHPQVINGCSDLFVAVLGDRGRHARSAIGMGSLPMNISVEIEAVMRIVE
jgi:enamine deaminase RidA (YjgF/YER057c/UK114 family)